MAHIPVLLNEVIEYLNPKPGDKIIDATFSAGGHGAAILKEIQPGGKILGIELDGELFDKAREEFGGVKEIILVNDNYRNLKKTTRENDFLEADGILFDLGMSSWHLSESGRGFSFQKDEPLDMRFNPSTSSGQAAREIINQWPPEEIEKILREYGEEKFARQISKAVIEARKKKSIVSTFQLVEVIKKAVPLWYQHRRISFATKTFQALRIAVNDELGNLEAGLKQMPEVLKKGGRGAVISFHSLEDRIVKNRFKELKKAGIAEIITKKPVRPTGKETAKNSRSRSAKLRVIELK
ncbi:MAG: 16S rRNA (cytosine(1402)-N(4))-methyltransferase RsmH [Parcubacteria group bacterium]|nr:16S rRNA (cytosine(1402)-N(4))-methyltransferase RsmH [Parcubacteria group bacterium]